MYRIVMINPVEGTVKLAIAQYETVHAALIQAEAWNRSIWIDRLFVVTEEEYEYWVKVRQAQESQAPAESSTD